MQNTSEFSTIFEQSHDGIEDCERPGTDKYITNVKYFDFLTPIDYLNGLTIRIPLSSLHLSMEEECLAYASAHPDGNWENEYKYVVYGVARQQDEGGGRIKDFGHDGLTLSDFVQLGVDRNANLSAAEVAAIRLYTGVWYKPWNHALRSKKYVGWETCITVLYCAILKVPFVFSPVVQTLYRGVHETECKLPPDFFPKPGDSITVTGGVEPGFMSTTPDLEVAKEYSCRNNSQLEQRTIFEMECVFPNSGADVRWCSQYPQENEQLYPPHTFFTCLNVDYFPEDSIAAGIRRLKVRAAISNMRHNVDCIQTVLHRYSHTAPGETTTTACFVDDVSVPDAAAVSMAASIDQCPVSSIDATATSTETLDDQDNNISSLDDEISDIINTRPVDGINTSPVADINTIPVDDKIAETSDVPSQEETLQPSPPIPAIPPDRLWHINITNGCGWYTGEMIPWPDAPSRYVAHGHGTIVWKTKGLNNNVGATYEGIWKFGQRCGPGKYRVSKDDDWEAIDWIEDS